MHTDEQIVEIGAPYFCRELLKDAKPHSDGTPAHERSWEHGAKAWRAHMRAAVAALRKAGLEVEQGWRFDMENAPRDGTPVDLWVVSNEDGSNVDSVSFYCNHLDRFNAKTRRREGRVADMVWERRGPNEGWYTVGGLPGMAMTVKPVAWRPLPPPPATGGET